MKFLFDFLPVLLFFITFKTAGIFVATAVAIAATVGQIAWLWFRKRKIDTMLWVSLGIVSVFGGMTLIFQDETFIKWKPTVLYWAFAAVLAGGVLFFRRNLMRSLLAAQLTIPDPVWNKLNWAWVGFFLFMGIANLAVAYNFSTDDWVNFKLFGGMGLMLVFVIAQGLMLSKYIEEEK